MTQYPWYLMDEAHRKSLLMAFNRRFYKSSGEFFRDCWFPISNRKRLREAGQKGLISVPFRERLMMAVTAVNGCRYCSYFHAKMALKSGIGPDEIRGLLAGTVDDCPEEEAVALIYAQHWAESDAHADPEAVQRLQQTYGVEKAEAIHLMLRVIRGGNLMGNSWDYFLHRISLGRRGGSTSSRG